MAQLARHGGKMLRSTVKFEACIRNIIFHVKCSSSLHALLACNCLTLRRLPPYLVCSDLHRWYTLRNKPDSKKPAKNRGEIEVKVTFIVQSTPAASTTSLSKTSLSSSALSLSMLKKSRIKSLANSMGE